MIKTGWSKAMGIQNEKSGRNKAVDVKKCENWVEYREGSL